MSLTLDILPQPSSGSIAARHYRTGEPLRLQWENDVLTAITPSLEADCTDLWVAPGLLDLQVNGYAGIDFQSDSPLTETDLLRVVRKLREDGCHRFLLTLITSEWSTLLARLQHLRSLIRSHPELHAAIPGWHIEGPFISSESGFIGAHDVRYACDATPVHLHDLKRIVGNDPLLLTLAPERDGSVAAIHEAIQCGFVVSLGHTNASRQQLEAAHQAGASAFTHLGNGCPQTLDRHNNLLWRVLDRPLFHAGIIPDGIHVSPSLFRIMHQLLPASQVWWTTDAMSAASAGTGSFSIGPTRVQVSADGIVRHPTTGGFAGSSLTPIEGIRRGSAMLNRSWRDCWDFFSTHPAELLDLTSDLSPNHPAGFVILRHSPTPH